MTLLLAGVSVLSIRAVRGELLNYLMVWCSVCGLRAIIAIASFACDWLAKRIRESRPFAVVIAAATVLVVLALGDSVPRSPAIGDANVDVMGLGPIVNDFVRTRFGEVPTLYIASRDTWPIAVGVALDLVKRGKPVAVHDEWLNVVERPLRENARFASGSRLC